MTKEELRAIGDYWLNPSGGKRAVARRAVQDVPKLIAALEAVVQRAHSVEAQLSEVEANHEAALRFGSDTAELFGLKAAIARVKTLLDGNTVTVPCPADEFYDQREAVLVEDVWKALGEHG